MRQNKLFDYEGTKLVLKKVISPLHIAKFAKMLTSVKKDTVICITGYPGEGKSVLAREIAKAFDKHYDDDRNCIYDRKELINKIENFRPSAFVLDEAINLIYKRDWNTSGQKELIKVLNICRSKRHLLIFVQPAFSDLDKDVRRYRLRMWIYCVTRGVGIAFIPEISLAGEEDPWNLKENDYFIKRHVKRFGRIIGTLEGAFRTRNFLSYIRWENISKEEYEKYEMIKDKKKYSNEEEKIIVFTKEEAEKKSLEDTIRTCVILESQGKMRVGWRSIVSSVFNTSQHAVDVLVKKYRVALGIIKEKIPETNNITIKEEDILF